MIQGYVNAALEAILSLMVHDTNGRPIQVDAVIDTGFDGFVTMPPAVIASLGLVWRTRNRGWLADGSVVYFDVFDATLIWDGKTMLVAVEATGTNPLIGTGLLVGFDLRIQMKAGGLVTLEALP